METCPKDNIENDGTSGNLETLTAPTTTTQAKRKMSVKVVERSRMMMTRRQGIIMWEACGGNELSILPPPTGVKKQGQR